MSLIVDGIRDVLRRARSGRSNQARSGSSTRSKLAWPKLEDVPLPDKKKAIEKRRKKELTTRRKKWVVTLIGTVFAIPVVWLVGGVLFGLATMGSRLAVPFPTSTQSQSPTAVSTPSQSAQPVQSARSEAQPETQKTFEISLQAGETKMAVETGPGMTWRIECNNKPFIIYGVGEDGSKSPEHQMLPPVSGWGGDVRRGVLIVRGVENDTLIKFFRQ